MAHESTAASPTGYSRSQYIIAIGLVAAVCITFSLYTIPTPVIEHPYVETEIPEAEGDVIHHVASYQPVQPDPLFQLIVTSR